MRLATQPNPTEHSSPLEQLHADRAGLTRELVGLQASSARLRETANAEATVLREIGEMGSSEIAAMTSWASGGCVGDAPAPDLKQRRALAEKLAAEQSAAAAAKGAGQDIDAKIVSINHELAGISQAIEKATLDAMQADFRGLNDQHLAATEAIRKLTAKLHGLCSYLSKEGRRRIERGEHETGKAYLSRAEALTGVKLPSPGVSQYEIIEAANDWARRACSEQGASIMTTAEALAIATQAKPKHRQPLTKLQASNIAKRLSAGTDTLNKSYTAMSSTLADTQKQLDGARAGVNLYASAMKINLTETKQ
jgi:hypothetical protein